MLRRVHIKGFKSFADDIVLDLGPGVNVIVGPNGSGKSNFAEAIVWALGEQRSGKLRAPGMQDVLYQGTPSRAGAGLAEVSLQFEGDESGAVSELEVRRRLTRAGESIYRVNGAACRLLDVQESLSMRGLGSDSLAVIRQGQVETLATSRPHERRAMLDEAAGVGVAKRRRKRAEQKLARVAEKLDRARDLAAELTSRARALERQARAAERAAALEQEIVELRESERAARAVVAAEALAAARVEHATTTTADLEAQALLEQARSARAAETASRATAVGVLEAAESVAATLRAAADRIAGRAELAADRVAELESRQERLGQARTEAARRLVDLEAAEAQIGVELAAASATLAAAQDAAHAAEQAEIRFRGEEIAAGESVRRAGAELAAAEGAVADADRRAAAAHEDIERSQRALAEMGDHDPDRMGRAERRAQIGTTRSERDRARFDAAQAAWDDATAALRTAEQRLRDATGAVRLLAPDDDRGAGAALLGDGLEVQPGMEQAIAAAIGAFADAVMAESVGDAKRLLAEGAANVVVPAAGEPGDDGPPGSIRLADVVTTCPEATRGHVTRLLANAWLVDDLESVSATRAGVFVTRDGVAYVPRRGTLSAVQGSWARKALHRRALEDERAAAAAVDSCTVSVADAAARRDAVRARQAASDRSASRSGEALATLRAQSAAVAERRERLRGDAAESERLRDDAIRAAQQARVRVAQLGEELSTAQAAMAAAREAAHGASAELERVRATVREARAAASAVDARAAEIQSAAASARAIIGTADALPASLELVARAAGALAGAAQAFTPAAERAAGEVARARAGFASAEERLAATHRQVEAAEAAAGEAREVVHRAEMALRLAEERAQEAGPAPAERPEVTPEPEVLAERLADLERRRLNIGAVNELAATERAELAEREQQIVEQVADLEESSAALRTHLGELDSAVDAGFEAIYKSVSERFSEVVGLLFPGGTGRLRLVEPEDEDGEEGVEVEVVPANKRPRALSLLSGGERSLIAMAFCLALAMARPAPFYLLDEVEAALDDANLRRFLGVIRRLAGETQFLVITHQQPTVEIADTLFGVTMGADGASQVLSRRLAQSVEGPARPYVRRQLRLVNS